MNPARTGITTSILLSVAILGGCSSGPQPVETLRTNGDRSYQLGAYDEAAGSYREITERYPGDWLAQYRLGLCELELERPAAAVRALRVAADQRPRNDDIADALAEAYMMAGDDAELDAFLRDRATADKTARGHLRLARYAIRLGDPDTARTAIATAIAIDVDPTGERMPSIEPYLLAAQLAEEFGDDDEARRRLRQAYGIDPTDERAIGGLRSLGEIPGPSIALPPGR